MEITRHRTGRMYICESNPAGLESAQFDFAHPKATVLYQESFGQDLIWEIGMDGQYRLLCPAGDALLGYWDNANGFHLQIFDLGTQDF